LIASGGIEAIVYLHSPNDVQNPIKKLVGHSANITNISFSFEIEKFLDDETYGFHFFHFFTFYLH